MGMGRNIYNQFFVPLFDCHSLSIETLSCTVHSLNMQTTFALAALASVAFALPQGGPSNKAPETPSPAGCQQSYDGEFQITIVNGSSTAMAKRQTSTCGQANLLTAKLADGVLTDAQGRIGSIVANYQFQFDGPPPQAGALYTAGFSVCQNGTLAIGGSAVFYACKSGDFSNLYDRARAAQCEPVFLNVLPCGSSGGAGQQPDGQPTFTSAAPPVSQIGDGQPQATTAVNPPITQIGDGQVQGPTAPPMPPVTQISDGQVQVPTVAPTPVTQVCISILAPSRHILTRYRSPMDKFRSQLSLLLQSPRSLMDRFRSQLSHPPQSRKSQTARFKSQPPPLAQPSPRFPMVKSRPTPLSQS